MAELGDPRGVISISEISTFPTPYTASFQLSYTQRPTFDECGPLGVQ